MDEDNLIMPDVSEDEVTEESTDAVDTSLGGDDVGGDMMTDEPTPVEEEE